MDPKVDDVNDELLLENSRLQLKLRAQEAVCQKLIREKAAALHSCDQSEEKIRFVYVQNRSVYFLTLTRNYVAAGT